jgi:phytanoyl-CoA hydroxylase
MTRTEAQDGVEWKEGKPDFSDVTLEPLEVLAGTLVVLHGSNVHGSNANTSAVSRHAYSMHVVEGNGAEWLPDNWLQRSSELPFEPLY